MKKGQSNPHKAGGEWLEQLSKAALIDLVLDASEVLFDDCDEGEVVERLREWATPRLVIRKDRIPAIGGAS